MHTANTRLQPTSTPTEHVTSTTIRLIPSPGQPRHTNSKVEDLKSPGVSPPPPPTSTHTQGNAAPLPPLPYHTYPPHTSTQHGATTHVPASSTCSRAQAPHAAPISPAPSHAHPYGPGAGWHRQATRTQPDRPLAPPPQRPRGAGRGQGWCQRCPRPSPAHPCAR
jgi:hypothetical protein